MGIPRASPVSTAQPEGWPANAANPPAPRAAPAPMTYDGTANSASSRISDEVTSAHDHTEPRQAVEQHAEVEHRTEPDDQVPADSWTNRLGQHPVVHQEQGHTVGAHGERGQERKHVQDRGWSICRPEEDDQD